MAFHAGCVTRPSRGTPASTSLWARRRLLPPTSPARGGSHNRQSSRDLQARSSRGRVEVSLPSLSGGVRGRDAEAEPTRMCLPAYPGKRGQGKRRGRQFALDNTMTMEYEYSPITQRPRLEWPGGKRVALLITFTLETWDLVKDTDAPYYAGGPPILPDTLPGRVADFPNYSWREYGQRVGIWRQFAAVRRAGRHARLHAQRGDLRAAPADGAGRPGTRLRADRA